MIAIGKTLKHRRMALGFSQSQLAHRASLSLASIQKIERGSVSPRWESLEDLLQSLSLNFSISEKEINLDALAAIGVPIAQKNDVHETFELSESIRLIIFQFTHFPERVQEAIEAFVLALKLHFPSQFQKLYRENKKIVELLPSKIDGRMIKLSRIAKSNLSRDL